MIELGFQGDLADSREVACCLAKAGLSERGCRSKADLFAKAAAALPAGSKHAFFVPGRIEVLGKHTDYAGGRTMVAAAERGFCLVLTPRDDRQVSVTDVVCGERTEFELDPERVPRAGHWSNYPMTVARRVARNFHDPLQGADIAFASDLPPASGMSSSSALLIVMFLALDRVNQLSDRAEYLQNIHDPTELAGYLATIENGQTFGTLVGDRGVGTFGGSEDHTAILCGLPGQVSQYSYCPVRFERALPLPPGYTFAIGSSGVVAEKTGTAMEKYNTASRLALQLAELWRRETGRDEPHLAAALASSPDAADRLKRLLGCDAAALAARLEHFIGENQEVLPAAGNALASGDVAAFGRLVDRSQKLAETRLGNQVPETILLAAAARKHGAAAASAFGAGFGGSVWALVETASVDAFLAAWKETYLAAFPQHATRAGFFETGASPAAFRLC